MRVAHLAVAAAASLIGFRSPAQQQRIPVRTLGPIASTDSAVVRAATSVRPLSFGGVLVLDNSRRRIVLLDSTMKRVTTVADTAVGAPNKFPYHPGYKLISYFGDSTVFADFDSQSLLVIAPNGTFARVMAAPKPSDLQFLNGASTAIDPRGRLVYRSDRYPPANAPPSSPNDGPGKVTIVYGPDSAPIMRSDFNTRSVDTVVMFRIARAKMAYMTLARGSSFGTVVFDPLPLTDDWTLLPDGTIAIARGQDYHIDWLDMNGNMTSTPKMPFDWKRITLEEKQALNDSLRKADSVRRAHLPPPPPPSMVLEGGAARDPNRIPFTPIEPSEMSDYYPPVRYGQMRADPEGNAWLLPTTSLLSTGSITGPLTAPTGGLVYDVVNRRGAIVERVRLPEKRVLVGIGPGGVVYMNYAPAPGVVYLERAKVQR